MQTTKDAKLGTYVRYNDANIRIDNIESVRHVDGNPLVKELDAGENGYVIGSLSVQNPGAGTAEAPGRIAPKESIRDGSPMLRFQINATDITPLAEIPRPKSTH
ncbi:MAG: hypothetical protein ABR591_13305 [Candidatus Velthaea sp.]